ncbi:ABC transporter substrate binding protein [Sulfurimonas sp. HSL3-7]|uniref:ABC transporter substrate binding protein n=1 Tax=Sulfonitrofixus jiaomeiensis TaxID=3131938 RepID=UPI0031F9EC6F
MIRTIFVLFLTVLSLWAKPAYTIAIVTDGPTDFNEDFEEQMKDEIDQLLGRDFDVRFPDELRFDGAWDYTKISQDVDKALGARQSDLVITLGMLSSQIAATKKKYKKPLIASTVINPNMQGIPFRNGTSNTRNLTYINGYFDIKDDIEVIKSIIGAEKVGVLINSNLYRHAPHIVKYIKKSFKKEGIATQVIPAEKELNKIIDTISDDVDFIYVTPLFQKNDEVRRELYSALRLKELPSFSALGRDDVELGALFGNIPASDNKRLIRQIALQVQQISLGFNPSRLAVSFKPYPALSLNSQTAKDVGFTPSWDLISRSTILEADDSDSHYFSIEEIMDRAVGYNLSILQAEQQVEVSKKNVEMADALFMPQINVSLEGKQIDEGRAVKSFGILQESQLNGSVSLQQNLYNQSQYANISINKDFLSATRHEVDQAKLEIALQSSLLYLKILQYKNRLELQKSNLELSKNNLRSAITKQDIGIGNQSDIYRWESKIANDKKDVLFTHALIQQTQFTLNALLNLPQKLPLNFEKVTMEDPVFLTHDKKIRDYFENPADFSIFEGFLVKTGHDNSPELRQFDALARAKKLMYEASDAALYTPDVIFQAGYRYKFLDEDPYFPNPNQTQIEVVQGLEDFGPSEYEVGILATLPLYTGGYQTAEKESAKAALLTAQSQQRDVENNVERDIRNALYQAKASYLSIDLSHDAYIAANKNLEHMTAIYLQGNGDILHLLDAQNSTLKAALVENNTRYGFMADLLRLQRNIGQVNFNIDDDEREEWSKKIQEFENGEKE